MNALKHGLTSNSVTIPFDSLDEYDRHVKSYFDALQPKGPIETDLVRSLADTAWRLNRIARMEDNFMFLPLDIQAKSVVAMSMHSQRLSRQFERTEKHLRELQELRRTQEEVQEEPNLREFKGENHQAAAAGFVFLNPLETTACIKKTAAKNGA